MFWNTIHAKCLLCTIFFFGYSKPIFQTNDRLIICGPDAITLSSTPGLCTKLDFVLSSSQGLCTIRYHNVDLARNLPGLTCGSFCNWQVGQLDPQWAIIQDVLHCLHYGFCIKTLRQHFPFGIEWRYLQNWREHPDSNGWLSDFFFFRNESAAVKFCYILYICLMV